MTSPLKLAVAALAQKRGQPIMKLEEAKLTLCYDLRWCDPGQAEKLVMAALAAGYLEPDSRGYKVTFPPEEVEVPSDFKPDMEQLLAVKDQPLFSRLLKELESATDQDRRQLTARINRSQKAHGLTDIEVEGLLVGARLGVDLRDLYTPVADLLKNRYLKVAKTT